MRIGDNMRRKIDAGIANSRFGIVVLSHAFFAKNWSQYELDGLVNREMGDGSQIVLPLWHRITRGEVAAQSPSVAFRRRGSAATRSPFRCRTAHHTRSEMVTA